MQFIQATEGDTKAIAALVSKTIASVYPNYYPTEVVAFFLKLHSEEAIHRDILRGNVWTLLAGGQLLGTGSYEQNHITRVYVAPEQQKKGMAALLWNNWNKPFAKNTPKQYWTPPCLPAVCMKKGDTALCGICNGRWKMA